MKFRSVRIIIIYNVYTCRYIIQATTVVVWWLYYIITVLLYRKTDGRKNDLSHLGGGWNHQSENFSNKGLSTVIIDRRIHLHGYNTRILYRTCAWDYRNFWRQFFASSFPRSVFSNGPDIIIPLLRIPDRVYIMDKHLSISIIIIIHLLLCLINILIYIIKYQYYNILLQ